MAKKKISGLPAGSALNGTELVPIVQAGTTKRTTTQAIADLGNASSVSGSGTINRLPKFTASSTLGDSAFFDDGTNQGIETTTAVNRFIMSANASIAKIFSFRSANLPRWAFRVDGTESGSNAGADLAIRRYNDAGTYIDSPMTMNRSDGKATFASSVGIGATPLAPLHVKGPTSLPENAFYLTNNNYSFGSTGSIIRMGHIATTGNSIAIIENLNGGGTSGATLAINAVGGNVLIGTTTDSGFKLSVNGSANATTVSASNRTVLSAGGIYDNATNGNNVGISFGGGLIIGTNGSGTYTPLNFGRSDLPWADAYFSGSVAIGNPVNAGVAVASTHKVTIVIGGVTYYLLASNV